MSNNLQADTIDGGERVAVLLQQSKEHAKQITKEAKVNFSKWAVFSSICIPLVFLKFCAFSSSALQTLQNSGTCAGSVSGWGKTERVTEVL